MCILECTCISLSILKKLIFYSKHDHSILKYWVARKYRPSLYWRLVTHVMKVLTNTFYSRWKIKITQEGGLTRVDLAHTVRNKSIHSSNARRAEICTFRLKVLLCGSLTRCLDVGFYVSLQMKICRMYSLLLSTENGHLRHTNFSLDYLICGTRLPP